MLLDSQRIFNVNYILAPFTGAFLEYKAGEAVVFPAGPLGKQKATKPILHNLDNF